MPYALILVGLVLTVAGVRDKQDVLFTQVRADFTGPNSYGVWVAAILAIGAVGYVPTLQPLSRVFLALVLVVLLLHNGTVFNQFKDALTGVPTGAAK